MQLLEKLRAAAAVVGEGVNLWVDPPRVANVTVTLDREWESRRAAQRAEFAQRNPEFVARQKREAEEYRKRGLVREPKKLRNYHLRLKHLRTGAEWDARLSIDVERRRVDWSYTSNGLFGNGQWGSGGVGLLVVTLPSSALLSPYIAVRSRLYAAQEEREGISRHASALLKALDGQLTEDERRDLLDVFKNEWSHERLLRQTVSFERAKEFLKGLSLLEERVSAEEAQKYGDGESTGLHWFDENGDCLASGSFYGTRDHYVQVLASTFEGKEADVLAACYARRRLRIDSVEQEK